MSGGSRHRARRDAGTQNLTDGEIFYIIENGVRFTGMPGWVGEDEENWKLVLFIRHLPRLTQQELNAMQKINRLGEERQAAIIIRYQTGKHDADSR
jgi:hypothetical protein